MTTPSTITADAKSKEFSFATVKIAIIALCGLYLFEFVCIFFLPAQDDGHFSFNLRAGTADLWVVWIVRLALCLIVCVVAVKKAVSRVADAEAEQKPPAAEHSVVVPSKQIQQQNSESTPLLVDGPASLATAAEEDDKARIASSSDEIQKFKEVVVKIKDGELLRRLWGMRRDRVFLLNVAFGITFVAHVAANIFISVKALEFRYDENAVKNETAGGNATSTNSSNASASLLDSVASVIVTTIAPASAAAATRAPIPLPSTIWHGPVPPPTWVAVLISLLILWSTVELFSIHFFFAAVTKTLAETDIPAFRFLHPHGLAFERETVLSKCNICSIRFRPHEDKFRCASCDFYCCSNCVSIKMQQWIEKLEQEEMEQRQAAAAAAAVAEETPFSPTSEDDIAAAASSSPAAATAAASPAASASATDNKPAPSSSAAAGGGDPPVVVVGSADRIILVQVSKWQILRELWSITRGFRHLICIGAAVLLIGTGVNIATPKLQGDVISAIIDRNLHNVARTLTVFSLLSLGRLLLSGSRMYAVIMTARLAINALRSRVFGAILARDFGFFDSMTSGVLQSRLTTDTNSMISPLQVLVNQVAQNAILLVGSTVMSLSISWQLSLFTFSILGPIVYLTTRYAKYTQVLQRSIGDSLADSNNIAQESFQNIRTVQSFGTERFERKRYGKAMEQTVNLAKLTAFANAALVLVLSSFDLVVWTLTLGCGGYLVINHPDELDVGELVAFQLYVNQMNTAVRGIADSLNQLTKSAGAAERVMNIMRRQDGDPSLRDDADDEDDDPTKKRKKRNNTTEPEGKKRNGLMVVPKSSSSCWIRLDNVKFTYPTRPAQQILKGISLDLCRPGEITALVSASGGGKSTIFQLLLKFYRLQAGAIRIGFRKPGAAFASSSRKRASSPPDQTAAAASTVAAPSASSPDATAAASAAAAAAAISADNNSPTMPTENSSSTMLPTGSGGGMTMERSNTAASIGEDDETFYDPEKFEFCDLANIDRRSWLKDIAIVSQRTELWNGTVKENLKYGSFLSDDDTEDDDGDDSSRKETGEQRCARRKQREEDQMARIVEAAKAAQAHDFIQTLPEGYDSVCGERGTQLSGGQAQRLAIARALLRKPALLLLDEATSALDNESEAKVQESIEALLEENKRSRSMSILIIAHRLSSIKNADRICVLEKGMLVQEGSHDQLMKQDGLYRSYVEKGIPKAASVEEKGGGARGKKRKEKQ